MYIWTYLYIGGNAATGMDEKMGPRFHLTERTTCNAKQKTEGMDRGRAGKQESEVSLKLRKERISREQAWPTEPKSIKRKVQRKGLLGMEKPMIWFI